MVVAMILALACQESCTHPSQPQALRPQVVTTCCLLAPPCTIMSLHGQASLLTPLLRGQPVYRAVLGGRAPLCYQAGCAIDLVILPALHAL